MSAIVNTYTEYLSQRCPILCRRSRPPPTQRQVSSAYMRCLQEWNHILVNAHIILLLYKTGRLIAPSSVEVETRQNTYTEYLSQRCPILCRHSRPPSTQRQVSSAYTHVCNSEYIYWIPISALSYSSPPQSTPCYIETSKLRVYACLQEWIHILNTYLGAVLFFAATVDPLLLRDK
jgi:hypothetical protein